MHVWLKISKAKKNTLLESLMTLDGYKSQYVKDVCKFLIKQYPCARPLQSDQGVQIRLLQNDDGIKNYPRPRTMSNWVSVLSITRPDECVTDWVWTRTCLSDWVFAT